jgi:glycosyltransferase involved in cell wall biosynthesis
MVPLKILVFEAYPFFSGSQRITLNVCKVLKAQGHQVTLLLADDQYGSLQKNFEEHVFKIQHIATYKGLKNYGDEDSWFTKNLFFKSVFFGLLPFYIKSLKIINFKGYNYLYCCDPRGATMMLASAFFFRKKSILHFHGKNRLPKLLSKTLLSVFSKVICVSQEVSDSLPSSIKKNVIYNGIDFSQYEEIDSTTVSQEAEELSGIPSSQMKVFLYAGLLRPQKGIHHLIYAFERLLKSNPLTITPVLFLCGSAKTPAEEKIRDFLIDYCKEKEMEKNVFWLGWKNNVLAWMNYSDFFVFPTIDNEVNTFEGFGKEISSSEGLPTVLIESSLCGLFNIAANATGVKEIINNGQNGICYSNQEPDGLYHSILFALKNQMNYISFPNSQNFSLKTFDNKIISLFKENDKNCFYYRLA